jgi:hypothetical protein
VDPEDGEQAQHDREAEDEHSRRAQQQGGEDQDDDDDTRHLDVGVVVLDRQKGAEHQREDGQHQSHPLRRPLPLGTQAAQGAR